MSADFPVEQWPIDRLVPYARNARNISESAIAKVAASIKEFGWRQPIVVDVKDVIVVGHTRYLAARRLGYTQVPVHVAKDLKPSQIKAYRLMDNRSHEEATWDNEMLGIELLELKAEQFDVDLTGFERHEIIETVFGANEAPSEKKTPSAKDGLSFKVIVDCESELQQTELLDRFEAEGMKCRALIS